MIIYKCELESKHILLFMHLQFQQMETNNCDMFSLFKQCIYQITFGLFLFIEKPVIKQMTVSVELLFIRGIMAIIRISSKHALEA